MRWFSLTTGLMFVCLAGCGTQTVPPAPFGSEPARYESGNWSDGARFNLRCESFNENSISCQFGKEREGRAVERKSTLEFLPMAPRQSYISRLLAEAVELEIAQSPKVLREVPLSSDDLEPLRAVGRHPENCLADSKYGGMYMLCPVKGSTSSTVVFFFHGVCDRCRYQPVVLRKVN